MRNYDFTPLYHPTVGFDQITEIMDRVRVSGGSYNTYPAYNIEKTADDCYRISLAIPGLSADEITVEVNEGALIIAAEKSHAGEGKTYLHRGITTGEFERYFKLADHIQVVSASHLEGMLHVDLRREIPEALKRRRVEILKSDRKMVNENKLN